MRLLVTGGAGFIGSNFVRLALAGRADISVTVLDKLTYAGNRENLAGLDEDGRLHFVQGDICDASLVHDLIGDVDAIINFAAETHVDRSIQASGDFVRTDVEGTRTLLDAARTKGVRHVQISTDEVYGDIAAPLRSDETAPLRPRSPYSASKAAGDLMVQAYVHTYGLDAIITRCSNNYGPFQYPEKLIPLFITNALEGLPLPVYGDGMQERDWLFVDDHCRALMLLLESGQPGEIYNIGSELERPNLEVVNAIVRLTGADPAIIRHVVDRLGHDRRYALDCSKLHSLGWSPAVSFADGLGATVEWYRAHESWWRSCRSTAFDTYYAGQYGERLETARA
ncbi:MAG TPA: dTDP-glucose 4,6-dehydratase [Chloroflexota bacterium]|nr:dTDP-glucose 4,6-dehydratase [Chloroflexota bacterium]